MTITKNIKEAIINHAIDQLNDGVGEGVKGADLHNELYNMDYFIIGTYQAKEFLGSEVFEAIEIVKNYEQDNFGEVTTDLSDPEKVVNMLAYIVGEEFLQDSGTITCCWDDQLTRVDLDCIVLELDPTHVRTR